MAGPLARLAAFASALACATACIETTCSGSVYNTNGQYTVKFGVQDPAAVACGVYKDMATGPNSYTASAFGQLSIQTSSAFPDVNQTYAAGFLEAALTQERIWSHAGNMLAWIQDQFTNDTLPAVLENFYATQDAWMRQQVATNTSDYWVAFSTILAQFDGLVAGYAASAPANQALSKFQLALVGGVGDVLDLITALAPSAMKEPPTWDSLTNEDLMARVRKQNHCTGFIRVLGDFSELYFAHAAWFIWASTTRIYKHYQFALTQPAAVGKQQSFSSYPAYLSSLDDFYNVWDSGLAIIETTNSVFNTSLYSAVVPQSLFAWHRVRLANLLADSPPQWAAVVAEHNSGTYNNQYMALDVKRFVKGSALPADLLWIVEQVPGLVVSGDATQILSLGYWPSFNVPFWPEIYNISGYAEQVAKRTAANGGVMPTAIEGLDWQLAPRAKIFRRQAGSVSNLDDFLSFMRFNEYNTDPYANGDPWAAICSRGDLAPSGASPDGCLDGKASYASAWASKTAWAVNGPTTGALAPGGTLPPFNWSEFPTVPHAGLPQVYDFDFEAMVPAWV